MQSCSVDEVRRGSRCRRWSVAFRLACCIRLEFERLYEKWMNCELVFEGVRELLFDGLDCRCRFESDEGKKERSEEGGSQALVMTKLWEKDVFELEERGSEQLLIRWKLYRCLGVRGQQRNRHEEM